MFSYQIYDTQREELIFATYSQEKYKKKVKEIEQQGQTVNKKNSNIRTNVPPH